MTNRENSNDSFIQDYIPRVSRTFALTIKFLPRGLRNSVYSSYLLCRVADTLEDTDALPEEEKSRRLLKLRDLLQNAARGRGIDINSVSSIYKSIDKSIGDDHRLLAESGRLFEILEDLPDAHKKIIFKWVAEMAGGMARYSRLDGHTGDTIQSLKDVADWDRYCYYVAGTVGNMLTELFILHYNFDKDIARGLKKHQSSFGLGLQKVNVLKDVPDDRERRVCFLPGDILRQYGLSGYSLGDPSMTDKTGPFVNRIVDLTMPHLDDAIEYTTYFPGHLKGVRMFLVVPVYLATATLALVKSDPARAMVGPAVKISRDDVTRLVTAAEERIGSDRRLIEYYLVLRNKL